MFKRIIANIAYKIYFLGKVEYRNRIGGIKRAYYDKIATLHPTAMIEFDGSLRNHHGDKNGIQVGELSRIRGELLVFKQGGRISVGDHCYIGSGSRIWSAKNVTIGNRVLISHNVNIHDNISHPLDAEARHRDFMHIFHREPADTPDLRAESISIGDDAWLGFNVTVLKGVTIGKGAIIGACAVITRDVPDYAVVVGKAETEIVRYLNKD